MCLTARCLVYLLSTLYLGYWLGGLTGCGVSTGDLLLTGCGVSTAYYRLPTGCGVSTTYCLPTARPVRPRFFVPSMSAASEACEEVCVGPGFVFAVVLLLPSVRQRRALVLHIS